MTNLGKEQALDGISGFIRQAIRSIECSKSVQQVLRPLQLLGSVLLQQGAEQGEEGLAAVASPGASPPGWDQLLIYAGIVSQTFRTSQPACCGLDSLPARALYWLYFELWSGLLLSGDSPASSPPHFLLISPPPSSSSTAPHRHLRTPPPSLILPLPLVVASDWLSCFSSAQRAQLFHVHFTRAPAPALLQALVG